MVHRGPDDEGTYVDETSGVALGARRLSIIDVAGGHQPLANETGTVWAVLNGEIYNHRTLREQLRAAGHVFESATDTEVLVHLYEEYRDDMVHALDGMFAFAVWDVSRRRLLLARDRFGEKPMFYSVHGGVLRFASELSALRAGDPQSEELDPRSLDAFFVYGYVPGPRTLFRDVGQLSPAHVLTWQAEDGARTHRYWKPAAPTETPNGSRHELQTETRRLLENSLKTRLIADVPVGVFLSGGLDSALIAALTARYSPHPIRTFTVGYDVGDVNELGPAQVTARMLGSQHEELVLSSSEVVRRVPSLLAALDQPLGDPAIVPLHAVAELARSSVKVALGGEGADELFGGYPRYRWLARSERLSAHLPPRLASLTTSSLPHGITDSRFGRLADVVAPQSTLERHVGWVTARRRDERASLYAGDLRPYAARNDVVDDLLPLCETELDPSPADIMRLDQLHWLPDDVLAKADRAGMLVSLEVRSPYLSQELAEFAAGIPMSVHVSRGGKSLLRGVLADLMPRGWRSPRKVAFRVPTDAWLRQELAPLMREQVAEGTLYRDGWFNGQAASRLLNEHVSGEHDRSSVLWPLLSLGLWMDGVGLS